MERQKQIKNIIIVSSCAAMIPCFYMIVIAVVEILQQQIGFTLPAWYGNIRRVDLAVVIINIYFISLGLMFSIAVILQKINR